MPFVREARAGADRALVASARRCAGMARGGVGLLVDAQSMHRGS